MKSNFEFTTALQYQVKALKKIVSDFQSGERYITLQNECKNRLKSKDREISKIKGENKFSPSASVISPLQASEITGLKYELG
ncbi:MAG: hypothetical protein R3Y24_13085, partial [Eubacteriales bacterium]